MTTNFQQTPTGPAEPRRRKRRVFMWVILAVNVLFAIWLITGLVGASGTAEDFCAGQTFNEFYTKQDCLDSANTGAAVGTGIGVFLIVAFWMMVDVILGVIYLVTRRRPQG